MKSLLCALLLGALLTGSANAQGGMMPGPGTPHDTTPGIWTLLAVAQCSNSPGGTPCTTPAINTTGAKLIVVIQGFKTFGTSPFDSQGNTYAGLSGSTSTYSVLISYKISPSTSSSVTFSSTATFGWEVALAFTTAGTPTVDGVHTAACTSGAQTTVQPGSITPSVNNALLISGTVYDIPGGTLSVDSGFSIDQSYIYSSGNYVSGAAAHFSQSTAAAINPTWTGTTASSDFCAAMVAFHP